MKKLVFLMSIICFFLGQKTKGEDKGTFAVANILNLQSDPKFKMLIEKNIESISTTGPKCIEFKRKKYIIATYGIKYDPIKNGEKLNAEKIAILKAKAQIVAFVHGSKIINVTSYDVDVTAKTEKGTIKAQGSLEVNESFKETIEGTLKGAFTVAKWTNRLEDTVYVALGVEVP